MEFIEKERREGNIVFHLTTQGHYVMELGYRERQIAIAAQILKHKVFNETLRLHLQYGEMPDRRKIGVTPKFCVKFNERRNRAKFICRRQRHDRLPPMSIT